MGHQLKGPVRWLVFHDAPYYGQKAFALDRTRDRVWLAFGQSRLRSIQRGTGEETSHHGLGKGVELQDVRVDGSGTVWLLLSAFHPKGRGVPSWKSPASGKHAFNILRLVDDEPELFVSVPFESASELASSLGVSDDGLVLGPHEDGAAVYDVDGNVLDTYPVGSGAEQYPVCAISPNGTHVALTASESEVLLVDRAKGKEKRVGLIKQVLRLSISDRGAAHVYGYGPGQWGIYAVKRGKLTKISSNVHAEVSPDGKSVLEITEGEARLVPAGSKGKKTKIPVLIGREGRSLFVDKNTAIVRMKGDTPLLELNLKKL